MKIGLIAALNVNAAYLASRHDNVPLGLLCIAAVLKPAGYEVELLDPNIWITSGELQLTSNFESEIAAKIHERRFDVVGFSSLVNTYHHTLRIISALRKTDTEATIILGGPQATHTDVATLRAFSAPDIIVRGEGEMVVLNLLDAVENDKPLNQIEGITYREDNEVKRNPDAPLIADMNELPLPAYHLYPVQGKLGVFLDAGRGCPYKCNFCSTSVFWKRRFRQKSANRIVDEMEVLKYGYGVKSVDFTHDLFTLNKKNVREFCRIVLKRKLDLPWTCSTRIDAIDAPLLKTMSKAGCEAVLFGIESGSTHMQEIIGKGFDVSIIKNKIRQTVQSKIKTTASFIIGFPEEKEEDVAKTIDLAVELLGVSPLVNNAQIHLLAVTNDTKLWDQYKDKLLYDGIETDQVSGGVFAEKDPLIRQYPELFPGHYYLPTPNIDRDLLIDLHIFGLVANGLLRWSIVAASQKAGAYNIAKRWHEWRKKNMHEMPEMSSLQSNQMKFFGERMGTLGRFIKHDPENLGYKDEAFDTIVAHETEMMKLSTKFLNEPSLRNTTKPGTVLETCTYPYDPRILIDRLTTPKGKRRKLRKKSVKVRYIFAGWSAMTPTIMYEKVKPNKAGRKRPSAQRKITSKKRKRKR